MNNFSNRFLYIAFFGNLVLVGILGAYAYTQLLNSKVATDLLYNHPFKVTYATGRINTHVKSMQSHMKGVFLAQSKEELDNTVSLVRQDEALILDEFKTVFQNFLGDKADVDAAFRHFLSGNELRNSIILHVKEGRIQEAQQLFKTRASKYIPVQDKLMGKLSTFALNKANNVHSVVSKQQEEGLNLLIILFSSSLLIGVAIFIRILLTQKKLNLTLNNHLHLIDQNIHIATLDTQGNIIEVTNSLCRLIDTSALDVLGQPIQKVFVEPSQNIQKINDLIKMNVSGQEWTGEVLRVNPEGETCFLEVSAHPITDSDFNLTNIKVFFKDITHEKITEQLAETDKLTSLLNRRSFENTLKRQIRLARRNQLTLKFAILDIDYFKLFNDTYGHPEGDKALKKVALCISSVYLRADDYLFRLGGEEFGILYSLSNKDEGGSDRAEALKECVESLKIPHSLNTVSSYLTVSIGTVAYTGNETPSMDIIYRDADEALYDAKQTRNHIVNK